MNWCVFKIDDPDTWPKYNCPIVVSRSVDEWPEIYQWDNVEHVFLNDYKTLKLNKCLYSYIGYLPYIERELHPTVCKSEFACPYGSDDNGYCLFADELKCEHMETKTEYALGMKRIWKEY